MSGLGRILIVMGAAIFCVGLSSTDSVAASGPIVRVSILEGVERCTVTVRTPYTLRAPYTGDVLAVGQELKRVTVEPTPSGVRVGDTEHLIFGLHLVASGDEPIWVNDRPYHGELDLLKTTSGQLRVVNWVGLEQYLYGVVGNEMPFWWPKEALQSQAIAARTYVLFRQQERRQHDYDVLSTVASQVYGGARSERRRTTRMVDSTAGLVLMYQGQLVATFYHACCGGYTETVEARWPAYRVPPLTHAAPQTACRQSPHSTWERQLDWQTVADALTAAGHAVQLPCSIEVTTTTPSGRVESLTVQDPSGQHVLTGPAFRSALGVNVIKSLRFAMTQSEASLVVTGQGWGHGVGMCQWGAHGLAKQGWTVGAVLQHFYPGSTLHRISTDLHES